LVKERHDKRSEEELSNLAIKMKMKAMEKNLIKCNVEQL
jgi:hypothetical protein